MSKKAWIFVITTIFLALLQMGLALPGFQVLNYPQWLIFAILTVMATFSQIYEVEGTFRNAYYPHSVFFLAGSILLNPFLFSLMVIVPHLIEWAQKRLKKSTSLKAWYIQPFNIATHILAGFAAYNFYELFKAQDILQSWLGPILITFLALAYTAINHFLVAMALLLARGLSFQESGVLKWGSLIPDIVLGCLGYIIVSLWHNEPWMLPLAVSPLVLMYQSLKIPQLTKDAQLDAKTGLLNSKYFNKVVSTEFDTALLSNTSLSFLMADLDLMRNINNSYGHLAGDAVLAGIGKIIRQIIPDQNHAGRFGGEEFAVLLTGVNMEEARRMAERIRKEVEQTEFRVETYPDPIKATMSIGISSYPHNAKSVTDLMYTADLAVYQAKKSGRNRVIAFSDLSKEEVSLLNKKPKISKFKDNLELELQLRQALDENQFELYYQPKVDMLSDHISGMEALIRWNHPDRGMISPAEFIPVAEETGLILPLGKWILEEACRQVKIWNTFSRHHSPVVLGVNFSAIQFQREDVIEIVNNALKETGVNPAWLEIEITEGILMDNTAYTVNTLKKLKEIGIKLAMDDFGIGYSSLGYLRNFPIDTLKIDRSFITSLDKDEINQALIQAIVTLARKLKFSIVAEGIETEQERDQLLELGCAAGQGFLFARPMPAIEIDEFFRQEKLTSPRKRLSIIK